MKALVYLGSELLGERSFDEVERFISELPASERPDWGKTLVLEFKDGSHVLVSRDRYHDHEEVHFSIRAKWWRKSQAHSFLWEYIRPKLRGHCMRWASNFMGKGLIYHLSIVEEGGDRGWEGGRK